MINLEELQLYLSKIIGDSTYIDGIQFCDRFLTYMTQLNKFTFDITTSIHNVNLKNKRRLNKNIRHSFIGRSYQQLASYMYHKCHGRDWKYRVYSLPYGFEYYFGIDNVTVIDRYALPA
jgi:hypothetical protein